MHKIKEKLMQELYEVEEKLKKAGGGKLSAGDLEYIHKLTDSIKNIDKIEALEGGGYSEESQWMADGRMYGTSYDSGMSEARGRGRNAKRDSMGRYAREGGSSYNDGGSSYRNGSSYRGGYSRDDATEHIVEKMEELAETAPDEKHRRAIHQCIEKLENM